MPESSLDLQAIAPAAMSATQPLLWSVRRELWRPFHLYCAARGAGVACWIFHGLVLAAAQRSRMAGMDPGEQFLMEVMPYGHTGGCS